MSKRSPIQRTADNIIMAASQSMNQVYEAERTHGKCFNYRREVNMDVWIFEDRFELKVQRIA